MKRPYQPGDELIVVFVPPPPLPKLKLGEALTRIEQLALHIDILDAQAEQHWRELEPIALAEQRAEIRAAMPSARTVTYLEPLGTVTVTEAVAKNGGGESAFLDFCSDHWGSIKVYKL